MRLRGIPLSGGRDFTQSVSSDFLFTALYGDFTYEQVAGEIEEIFQQQYHLTTEATKEIVTETKK